MIARPKTGAFKAARHATFRLPELLKNVGDDLRFHPYSGIGHLNRHVIGTGPCGDGDTPGVRELDGVADQVRQDLVDRHAITEHTWQLVGDVDVDPQLFRGRLWR